MVLSIAIKSFLSIDTLVLLLFEATKLLLDEFWFELKLVPDAFRLALLFILLNVSATVFDMILSDMPFTIPITFSFIDDWIFCTEDNMGVNIESTFF